MKTLLLAMIALSFAFVGEPVVVNAETRNEEIGIRVEEDVIEIGKPLIMVDGTLTVTGMDLNTKEDVLIIEYTWENTSDKTYPPFFVVSFMGFQDGIETEHLITQSDVDYSIGQREMKPGAKLEGIQVGVCIDNINKPLLIELTPPFKFQEYTTYSLEIKDLHNIEDSLIEYEE